MLPRAQRLVAASDHRLVARRGRRARHDPLVVMGYLPAPAGPSVRLAVVVPKRVGTAPVRNRVRRRVRHLAATRMAELPSGGLFVVRAEASSATADTETLSSALNAAFDDVIARLRTQRQALPPTLSGSA